MELTLKTDKNGFIDIYLRVWNGLMNLTEKEFNVTKSILELYLEINQGGIEEPYLSELVFSMKNIKSIKAKHNLNSANWYSVKKSLIKKKVIYDKEGLSINPKLIPIKELNFKFILDENK